MKVDNFFKNLILLYIRVSSELTQSVSRPTDQTDRQTRLILLKAVLSFVGRQAGKRLEAHYRDRMGYGLCLYGDGKYGDPLG